MPGPSPDRHAESTVESDRELIDAINAGDADAFERLYHRCRGRVYCLAWLFTANHKDALDVLPETCTHLFRRFPGFVPPASLAKPPCRTDVHHARR